MTFQACLWCDRAYPPAIVSREHVLPDYLGAGLKLPAGAVCKQCNNRLNTDVDQPLKRLLQPLITHFGLKSAKRARSASTEVVVPTNIGPVPAVLRPEGRLEAPRLKRINEIQNGNEVFEQWIGSPDELAKMLEDRSTVDVQEVVWGFVEQSGTPYTSFHGSAATLLRATVRAAVNLVALSDMELLPHPAFAWARAYVLDGKLSVPEARALVSEPLRGGHISTDELRAEHAVRVWSEGPQLWCELRFFGDAFCRVMLGDSWNIDSPVNFEEKIRPR